MGELKSQIEVTRELVDIRATNLASGRISHVGEGTRLTARRNGEPIAERVVPHFSRILADLTGGFAIPTPLREPKIRFAEWSVRREAERISQRKGL